jgi:hypothetical protein
VKYRGQTGTIIFALAWVLLALYFLLGYALETPLWRITIAIGYVLYALWGLDRLERGGLKTYLWLTTPLTILILSLKAFARHALEYRSSGWPCNPEGDWACMVEWLASSAFLGYFAIPFMVIVTGFYAYGAGLVILAVVCGIFAWATGYRPAHVAKLDYRNGRYEAFATVDERRLVREAGFEWDEERRCWWTADTQRAATLADWAEGSVRESLERAAISPGSVTPVPRQP